MTDNPKIMTPPLIRSPKDIPRVSRIVDMRAMHIPYDNYGVLLYVAYPLCTDIHTYIMKLIHVTILCNMYMYIYMSLRLDFPDGMAIPLRCGIGSRR